MSHVRKSPDGSNAARVRLLVSCPKALQEIGNRNLAERLLIEDDACSGQETLFALGYINIDIGASSCALSHDSGATLTCEPPPGPALR